MVEDEKDKRYYWIKLKTDFFNQEEIDFLLSQKNGCEYVVLYQMLCLNTANNNGDLCSRIGEMLIPYDVEKIARETKYFTIDTIMVALELFKKLGLIYEQENQILKISSFDTMVGSETKWAKYKRNNRDKLENVQNNSKKLLENVQQEIDIRDKSKENKILDKDKEIYNTETIKQIIDYLNEKADKRFTTRNTANIRHINARLKEKYTLDDFKQVIDKKVADWKGTDMEQYLRPETLFGTKFESYLNSAKTSKPKSIREIYNLNIEEF